MRVFSIYIFIFVRIRDNTCNVRDISIMNKECEVSYDMKILVCECEYKYVSISIRGINHGC